MNWMRRGLEMVDRGRCVGCKCKAHRVGAVIMVRSWPSLPVTTLYRIPVYHLSSLSSLKTKPNRITQNPYVYRRREHTQPKA